MVYSDRFVHVSFRIELEMFEWMEIISDNLQELYLSIDKIYNTRKRERQCLSNRRKKKNFQYYHDRIIDHLSNFRTEMFDC